MRYKQLVEQKLEQIMNLMQSIDSLISSNATPKEMRNYVERVKNLIGELESLIQKENG